MAMITACPPPERWSEITQGQMSEAEADSLLEHLKACEACSQRLRQLPNEETLVESLRQGTVVEKPVPEIVARLIDQLKKLPLVSSSNDATIDVPQSSAPVAASSPRDEITQEIYASFDAAQAPDELGRLGGYRVLKLLGSGGMGAVFLAEDVHLQRQVALKVMRPGVAANVSAHDRFLREARACAALKHDNIVTIYQVGEERGVPFLAMEFLQGMPLDALLDSGRKLTTAQILRIAREIAKGLAAAHEKGLIHRDIKPANIWLDKQSGRVKILDFGLARTETENVNLTQSGTIVGTPAFMAPEQARGEKVDGRTDLFSLGALLYRVCTGRNPFQGANTLAVLTSLALDTPESVAKLNPTIPPELSSLIERLMAKAPAGRPDSARAVVAELQAIERSLAKPQAAPVPAPVPTAVPVAEKKPEPKAQPQAKKPARRLGVVVALALLGILGAVAAVIVYQIKTPNGTLVVEINDPDVQVVLKQNGVVVQDPTTKREFTLQAGDGELIVTDRDGVVLTTKAFAIKKGDITRVSVTIEGQAAVKPNPPIPGTASGFDGHRRETISADVLRAAGWGDPNNAPKELVAVFGEAKLNYPGAVTSLAFSPDGKRLAAGGSHRAAYIWDAATGAVATVIAQQSKPTEPKVVAWSPDGTRLALVFQGRPATLSIHDATTGAVVVTDFGNVARDEINSLVFSGDGRKLIALYSRDADSELRWWDTATGKQVKAQTLAGGRVYKMTLSPDGKLLAGCDASGTPHVAKVWDAETGEERFTAAHKANVTGVAFTSDSKRLVTTGRKPDASVKYWDTTTGKELPGGFTRTSDLKFLTASSGSAILATVVNEGVLVWSAETDKVLATMPINGIFTEDVQLALNPDGSTLAVGRSSGAVQLFDPTTGKPKLEPTGKRGVAFRAIASNDGRYVAVGGMGNDVRLYAAATGNEVAHFQHGYATSGKISFRPDGQRLFANGSPSEKTGITSWDVPGGKQPQVFLPKLSSCMALEYSPDGRRFLAAHGINGAVVAIYDAETGDKQVDLGTHTLQDLKCSPDGSLVAISVARDVTLYDAQTGKAVRSLESPEGGRIAFSPDSKRLAISHGIWDVESGKQVVNLARKITHFESIAFSPDGKTVAGYYQTWIVLWDAATGKIQRTIESPAVQLVRDLSFTPDSRHLVTANADGTAWVLRLADAKTPPVQPLVDGASPLDALKREAISAEERALLGGDLPLPNQLVAILGSGRFNHTSAVHTLAYRPDSKQIAAAGDDGIMRLWDTESGSLQAAWKGPRIATYALDYSPDGKTLAAGRNDKSVTLFRVEDGSTIAELKGHHRLPVRYVAYHPDGKRIFSASGNHLPAAGEVIAWDLATNKPLWKVDLEKHGLIAFALSADGKTLAGGSPLWRNSLVLWDTETGQEIRRLEKLKQVPHCVAFDPKGKHLAVGFEGTNATDVHVIDLTTGQAVRPLGTKLTTYTVAYSPDGRWIAGLSEQNKLQVWDVATGAVVKELVAPQFGQGGKVAFRPDGGQLALTSHTGGMVTWETTNWTSTWPDRGHCGEVRSAAVSGDGRWITSGATDGTVRVWDASTGKLVSTWIHTSTVAQVAFSPDGSRVAACGLAPVRVWDRATGRVLFTSSLSLSRYSGLAFSPDGTRLAFGNDAKLVVVDATTGASGEAFDLKAAIGLLEWSQDGRYLGVVHGTTASSIVEVATGKVTELKFKNGAVFDAFSPDGSRIVATASRGVGVAFWDTATNAEVFPWGEQPIPANHAIYSPDGKRVILRINGGVAVRDASDGKLLTEFTTPYFRDAHVVAPDGRHLVAGHPNGTLAVYRLADAKTVTAPVKTPFDGLRREKIDPEEIAVAGNGDAAGAPKDLVAVIGSTRLNTDLSVTGLAFRPDGKQLATMHSRGNPVLLWDPKTGRRLGKIDTDKTITTALAYSPDGKVLALGSDKKTIRLLDLQTQQTRRILTGHQREVIGLCFSPDGKRLYSASGSRFTPNGPGEVIAWNLESGEKSWTVPVEKEGVTELAIGQDGKHLLALCGTEIRRIDAADGKVLGKITGFKGTGIRIAYNSVTDQVAVTSRVSGQGYFAILDAETGKELHQQDIDQPGPVGFSPNGKTLALAAAHKTLLFDANRQVVREFPGTGDVAYALAFSPDGANLAIGHLCGVVFWNIVTGERLWPGAAHIGSINTVSVSGDGSRLVTTGADHTARVWDVVTGAMERQLNLPIPRGAVFFPTGSLVAGFSQQNIGVWDASTGHEKWKVPARGASFEAVAVSPDGSRILTNKGTGLRVSDAATGAEALVTEPIPNGGAKEVAWSPDDKWIAGTHQLPVEVATGKSPFPNEAVAQ